MGNEGNDLLSVDGDQDKSIVLYTTKDQDFGFGLDRLRNVGSIKTFGGNNTLLGNSADNTFWVKKCF